MSTRITQLTMARTVLDDVQRASRRATETQQRLSSGRELRRPSDDPTAVTRAIDLRTEIEGAQQNARNVGEAQGWAEVTDSALSGIGDALQRARELVVQGASEPAGPAARRAIATELRSLVETMKEAANASYGGRFVFAGAATDTRPYSATPGDLAYAGDTAAVSRQIGAGVAVQVNVTGVQVFGSAGGGMLATLTDIAARLDAGTPADLAALRGTTPGTGALGRLDVHLDELSAVRAQVGSTANRLEAARDRLGDLELSALRLLSQTEDTDMAKAMIEFSIQQSALQASMKAGSQIVQNSLLDFLR
jgi:flagellar hook-associated protein 3 FlgL